MRYKQFTNKKQKNLAYINFPLLKLFLYLAATFKVLPVLGCYTKAYKYFSDYFYIQRYNIGYALQYTSYSTLADDR